MSSQASSTGSVIVGGARTPFGKLLGGLASQSATDLGGIAIAAALAGPAQAGFVPRPRHAHYRRFCEADGEVMIGTDVGLCSYFSNASRPQPALDKSNIKVYPNPVRPEFTGVLAVSGLTANADVRIVNTAGHVVAGGRSVGGTFTWDLRGTDGFRVPSGVYDIMVVTNEANKGIVAKVTII